MPKSVYTERYRRLCRLLIQARQEAGLTQEDLAVRLGKPQSYVSKVERGERRLDLAEMLDITDALEIDPCILISNILKLS